MTCNIFISYATGDENNAGELYDTLSELEDIKVYRLDWVEEKNLGHKIKDALDNSNLVIVLITFNSTNTMWLNQEIGYACARNTPIVSIVEKGIDVKGFLEGESHITFQRGDFKSNIDQIIVKMQEVFPNLRF